jgi:hypothetical protein
MHDGSDFHGANRMSKNFKHEVIRFGRCSVRAVVLACMAVFLMGASAVDKSACTITVDGKSIKLHGKYQVVESFPDLKVQIVSSFPDLKVKQVTSFPDDCGEWQAVESFPDFKVQFVESFPDLEIQYVENFPGVP